MRERDLERATQLFAQIQSIDGDYGSHDTFGKNLRLHFEFAKETALHSEWAEVAKALDLNPDELHMRTNLLIRAMLDEKMTNIKAELRKLGVKLEADEPAPLVKKEKKQKLLPAPSNGGSK